ncbi:MAG: helix-turn-helix domain-containing protein [Rhodobacterales bacterium]
MDGDIELSDTKMELLLAAERLFALQGIAATTIRQINAEAGQKNSSAIHYHFGSRDAILDAIIAIRVKPANDLRAELLIEERARAGGKPLSTEAIIRLLLQPGVDRFMNTQGPHFTHRFLIQLRMNFDAWRRYERKHMVWTLSELLTELRQTRPLLPAQIAHGRFRSAVNFSMLEMAEVEAAEGRLGSRFRREEAIFRIEELGCHLVSMLDAPIPAQTVAALECVAALDLGKRTDMPDLNSSNN